MIAAHVIPLIARTKDFQEWDTTDKPKRSLVLLTWGLCYDSDKEAPNRKELSEIWDFLNIIKEYY